jgi:hypothetical protein
LAQPIHEYPDQPVVVFGGAGQSEPEGQQAAFNGVSCPSIPISIIAPVSQDPVGVGKVPQEGGSAHVVADLACRHEELQRPALGIRQGMKLGIQPAFSAPDRPPVPPFSTTTLDGVK